jgi:hypothetical protein
MKYERLIKRLLELVYRLMTEEREGTITYGVGTTIEVDKALTTIYLDIVQ